MIGLFLRRGCRTHQAAIIEFAVHRAGGPDVRKALDHVDRCRGCEDDLAATTLVLHALRRLHEEACRVEPAPDSWARLRPRLAAARREPSRLLSGLPGIVAAVAICGALVGPAAIAGGASGAAYNEAPRAEPSLSLEFEQSRERAAPAGPAPTPAAASSYRGAGTAPSPVKAESPITSGRRARWLDQAVTSTPIAAPADPDTVIEQRQAGRR